MVNNCWFGARWFRFLGSPYERDWDTPIRGPQTTGPQTNNVPLADWSAMAALEFGLVIFCSLFWFAGVPTHWHSDFQSPVWHLAAAASLTAGCLGKNLPLISYSTYCEQRLSQSKSFEILKLHYLGVSQNSGTPKWMVKIMDPPKKMDDLGVPRFKETPIGSMYGIYTYMDGWFLWVFM